LGRHLPSQSLLVAVLSWLRPESVQSLERPLGLRLGPPLEPLWPFPQRRQRVRALRLGQLASVPVEPAELVLVFGRRPMKR